MHWIYFTNVQDANLTKQLYTALPESKTQLYTP